MGVGVDDGALVDVCGLEGGDGHHLETGAGAEDVPELRDAKLHHGDLSGHRDQMGHGDEIWDSILGRLKVGVLIIVVIIIVVINNFAPGEQRVSCAGCAAKSVSGAVTRVKQ